MQLIMAVSADNYFARCQNDDMKWLSKGDKQLFKLLTTLNGGQCIVSRSTAENMPNKLPGRTLYTVNRHTDMFALNDEYPNSWLLGGPKLAEYCLDQGLLTTVLLVKSYIEALPEEGQGISAVPFMKKLPELATNTAWLEALHVQVYRL